MKLSTKGRYGLKAMFYLGKNYNKTMSVTKLSELTETSPAYLEKLLAILKKSNLIYSVRGVNGGYSLSKDPSVISIGEILRALEGNLYLADCNSGKCSNLNCPAKSIFNTIYFRINKLLDDLSLLDMIRGNYE